MVTPQFPTWLTAMRWSVVQRTFMVLFTIVAAPIASSADQPIVQHGDRLTLIGGTMIESLQFAGQFEAALVLSNPELRVPVRNLGWSGDDPSATARRVFGSQADGYARMMADLEKAKPTIALLGYGWAEASNGSGDVKRFEANLNRLATDLQSKGMRLAFLEPFPLPGIRTPGYAQRMDQCKSIVVDVASQLNSPVVTVGDQLNRSDFDDRGLRLSAKGQQTVGLALAAALTGQPLSAVVQSSRSPSFARLAEQVVEKNALFFHHHRPMNETYLFLFRKHEQGNNAPEVDAFEPLVVAKEQTIWSHAATER